MPSISWTVEHEVSRADWSRLRAALLSQNANVISCYAFQHEVDRKSLVTALFRSFVWRKTVTRAKHKELKKFWGVVGRA